MPSRFQTVDSSGDPYTGARLFFYAAGSSTKQDTFTDETGNTANTNPVVLGSDGRPAVEIWLTVGESYKVGLAAPGSDDPPSGFVWTEDDVEGINDASITLDEWITGPAPTYISATSFSLVGDQTVDFTPGRRVKVTDAGGTKYGTIKTSTYTTLTTIVLDQTSDSLATPTSAVSYGILQGTIDSSTPILPANFPLRGDATDRSKQIDLDLSAIDTNTTRRWSAQNKALTVAGTSEFAYSNVSGSPGRQVFPRMWMSGLVQAQAADTDHDTTISVGECMDATNAQNMILSSALTKQIDANWTVGTNAGGLDTGAVGNTTWYYIWLIKRSDTGVVDALYSASASAPTMPANYDYKRLIGAVLTDGSANILAYTAYEKEGGGLQILWSTVTNDLSLSATLTTTARTDALRNPTGFATDVTFIARAIDASTWAVYVSCPDVTDQAPSVAGTAPHGQLFGGAAIADQKQLTIRTSSAGLIRSRSSLATLDTYILATTGFDWARRN